MAAPNIVNVANIVAKTASVIIANTSVFSIANNAASSSQVWKINTIFLSNYGTSSVNTAVNLYGSAGITGTVYPMANNLTIPAGSTLVFSDKTSAFYLEEDKSIGVSALTGNTISAVCSYEIIA